MPPFFAELLSQMKAIWARLDAGQRLVIAVVMLATVAGLLAIVWFAGQPDRVRLLSPTEPHDLMQATSALERASVPYELEGNSIVVLSHDWDAAKRALVSAGVGGGGIAETSELSAMTSDRATRMHALARMMENDAQRKLMAIRGVVHAQVSHSKPKRSPYAALDDETQPRAHVGLRIRPGTSFLGIAKAAVHEASAALGIPPEFISVTNLATMQTHSEDGEGASGFDSSEFLAQQRQRSEELTSRAQSLLDRVYPDRAVVRVSVVLDPSWTTTRERGAPDKQAIVRTSTTKEDTVDPAPGPSAEGGSIGTADAASTHKKEQKETEYVPDGFKEVSSGTMAPAISKMTVAMVIDEKAVATPELEKSLRDLVKNAIGWSDEWATDADFTVLKTAMPELPELVETAGPGFMELVDRYGATVGQVIAVLLVLLFLRGLLKRSSTRAGQQSDAARAEPPPELSTPEDMSRRLRKEIEQAIAEDPASVTRMLESWLTEPKT